MGKRIMGQPWTAMLAAAGLESPGYHQCVEETAEITRKRKLAEEDRLNRKAKRKKKR